MPEPTDNEIIIEAWNTVLFEKFCRFRHLLVEGLSNHSEEAFRRHPPKRGSKVLDIGCGFGDTTLLLAERVGPEGSAVGVDCAENFIESARRDQARSGPDNASFFVADVQVDDLRGPYDHAYGRFGTMFFNLPGAAFRNIKRSLAPGGTFTQIVWRRREDNPWLHEAELRVKEILPVISHDETDQVHCGPGPFSLAGADLVSDMLTGIGYQKVTFERHDADICVGRDLNEAVEFTMALGPAGEIVRLSGEEGKRREAEVRAALRDALVPYERGTGVWGPSSVWFVSAQNPE